MIMDWCDQCGQRRAVRTIYPDSSGYPAYLCSDCFAEFEQSYAEHMKDVLEDR